MQIESDPTLASATLINGVMCDLLSNSGFQFFHYPELVDIAVVASGLGVLRSQLSFVQKGGSHWDPTQWEAAPRPFLNIQPLAYTNALTAWVRGDSNPIWAKELEGELRRPMLKSLKFLTKTNDSFFQRSTADERLLVQSQSSWWDLASSPLASQQVVALRHLNSAEDLTDDRLALLLKKLQVNDRAIVLHAIAAVERLSCTDDKIIAELRGLVNDHNEEVRSKSMCALALLERLDDISVDIAADMLDSSVKHNVFAGLYAFCSLDSVPEHALPAIDRGFQRALKACDYEFIGLYAAGYRRWLADPTAYVTEMLEQNSPEYLQVAREAITGAPQELVTLE
ncbi:MAG: hypothetical protein AB8B91_10055 [Rubripirellula sp.]